MAKKKAKIVKRRKQLPTPSTKLVSFEMVKVGPAFRVPGLQKRLTENPTPAAIDAAHSFLCNRLGLSIMSGSPVLSVLNTEPKIDKVKRMFKDLRHRLIGEENA